MPEQFYKKTVISASRRTDIPAFYMDWFMSRIEKGWFEVTNPYNRRIKIVPAASCDVHTIVFWSKNFGPFIRGRFGDRLKEIGYNLFFNFTINSFSPVLEPNVPPLNERLNQLEYLSKRYAPDCINWRFDPICFYKTKKSSAEDNLNQFNTIASAASNCGIKRCITSFMDHYPKIKKRVSSMEGFAFTDPPMEKKKEILMHIKCAAGLKNISLYTCCEKEVLEALPAGTGIRAASCIPNDLLMKLFGGKLSLKKDTGQRIKNGCGCMVSVDIGSYHMHPCFHNCLFCYANPASKGKSPEVMEKHK